MTMALLYYITPNRALFSVVCFSVLCYSACVSIKSIVYLSRLPLCASSILDLSVAVPAGAPEKYFVNAEDGIQFLPQGPTIHREKDFLAKNHRYKPGGFEKNNYLYDCGRV